MNLRLYWAAILNLKGTKSRSNHQNKYRFEFLNPKDPQMHVLNSSVGQTIIQVRFEALLGGHFEFEALLSGHFEFEGDNEWVKSSK